MVRDTDEYGLPRASPTPSGRSELTCTDCGASFPRRAVRTPAKGTLACPECGSTSLRHPDAD